MDLSSNSQSRERGGGREREREREIFLGLEAVRVMNVQHMVNKHNYKPRKQVDVTMGKEKDGLVGKGVGSDGLCRGLSASNLETMTIAG